MSYPLVPYVLQHRQASRCFTMISVQYDTRTSFKNKGENGLPLILTCASLMTKQLSMLAFHLLESCTPATKQKKRKRRVALFEQRLEWDVFCSKYAGRQDFIRHLRMSERSFNKLLGFIMDHLMVDTASILSLFDVFFERPLVPLQQRHHKQTNIKTTTQPTI